MAEDRDDFIIKSIREDREIREALAQAQQDEQKEIEKYVRITEGARTSTQKYQDQINALDLELARYKTMESERDEAIRKSGVDREKSRLFENENSVLSQEITLLKTTIDDQESALKRIPALDEEARKAKGELSNKTNEFNDLLKRSIEHSKTVSALGNQLESLKSEHKQLSSDNVQFKADKISAEEERRQVLEQDEKTKIFAAEMGKINTEVKTQNKE